MGESNCTSIVLAQRKEKAIQLWNVLAAMTSLVIMEVTFNNTASFKFVLCVLLYFEMNWTSVSKTPIFKLRESREQECSLFCWSIGDRLQHKGVH